MPTRSKIGNARAFYPSMKNKGDEWKELCKLVANESDPQRLSKHLDRLIRALDERKKALSSAADRRRPSGSAKGEKSV
jgi:hypothetical protein